MADSGASSGTGEYFALLKELHKFWRESLREQPALRALGRATASAPEKPVKADTVKAWLGGQFPQDIEKFLAVVRAIAAEAEARGVVPSGSRRAAVLDVRQWQKAYREEAERRARNISAGVQRGQGARALLNGLAIGRLLTEVTDPFDLEVHRPLRVDGLQRELPVLPVYIPREHDQALAEVVQEAVAGRSGIAVMVGDSSTGKTRACWEALETLRAQPEEWRLWHPIDPSRPQAAVDELPLIGPRTVVWLNEAQLYLNAPGGMGEKVAAGLRTLLRAPARTPVLVLATLWGEHWDALTTPPAEGAKDDHPDARVLLEDRDIPVPVAFTEEQVRQLHAAADPRLSQAAEMAEDGQVVQFLAGAPALLARYRNAPPTASALIAAAMDGRRLGMGIALSLAFLEHAAPAYLTDAEWDRFGTDGWLQRALDYTEKWLNGIRGPLTPIRPRPGDPGAAGGPSYRLADYLEQHARHSRRGVIPPTGFWIAVHHAVPGDLPTLARAAEDRGLLRDAARLRKRAVAHGSTREAAILMRDLHALHPDDPRPVRWAADHISLDDPRAVADLLDTLRSTGADSRQTAALAGRAAAGVPLDDPHAIGQLLKALQLAGQDQQFTELADRATASMPLQDTIGVGYLLKALQEGGADQRAVALADHAAASVSLDKPHHVRHLLQVMRTATGLDRQFAVLAERAAAGVPLDDPGAAAGLLDQFHWADATQQVTVLVRRNPATSATLDNPKSVTELLSRLEEVDAAQHAMLADRAAVGMPLLDANSIGHLMYHLLRTRTEGRQLAVLAERAAASVDLNEFLGSFEFLLGAFSRVGADELIAVLVDRAARHPRAAANLLKALWESSIERRLGADRQFAVLAERAAASVPLRNPKYVAELLRTLSLVASFRQHPLFSDHARVMASAQRQIAVLAERAAAGVPLDHPGAVADLLYQLRKAGADQQVEVLADRAAAGCPLHDPRGVMDLLSRLRQVDAERQISVLVERDPAASVSLDRRLDVEGMPFVLTGPSDGVLRYWPDLLDALLEVGAERQYAILVSRLPAEGMFRFFLRKTGDEQRYRFGREPDGSEAPEWGWMDLD